MGTNTNTDIDTTVDMDTKIDIDMAIDTDVNTEARSLKFQATFSTSSAPQISWAESCAQPSRLP